MDEIAMHTSSNVKIEIVSSNLLRLTVKMQLVLKRRKLGISTISRYLR